MKTLTAHLIAFTVYIYFSWWLRINIKKCLIFWEPLKKKTHDKYPLFLRIHLLVTVWHGCNKCIIWIGHFEKYHNTLCLSPQILHKHCFQFLLGLTMVPREEYYGIFQSGLLQLIDGRSDYRILSQEYMWYCENCFQLSIPVGRALHQHRRGQRVHIPLTPTEIFKCLY